MKRHHNQRTGVSIAVAVDGSQSGEMEKEGAQLGGPLHPGRP